MLEYLKKALGGIKDAFLLKAKDPVQMVQAEISSLKFFLNIWLISVIGAILMFAAIYFLPKESKPFMHWILVSFLVISVSSYFFTRRAISALKKIADRLNGREDESVTKIIKKNFDEGNRFLRLGLAKIFPRYIQKSK